jgi:tetratricopeptide (TPR) repeat protein
MHSILSYLLAAGAGVLIAHFISRPPELRSMRLSQLIFVPAAMVVCVYFLPGGGESSAVGGVGEFICFLGVLGFLVLLLAPNIAYLCGTGLSNLLDPQDWTSAEEEIALRPIRRLIDKDEYSQALADLDELLKKHKPTYEALLLKAKLLHHFGSVDETVATLLGLIELSRTTPQQLAVMELLAILEGRRQDSPRPLAAGTRRIEIHHELILLQMAADIAPPHKEIPPGAYEIEETIHHYRRWFKLAGEDWGNAEMCWEAVMVHPRPVPAPLKKGFFGQIARMHRAITAALKRKPRLQQQAEAKTLFNEASQYIRSDDWQKALPLLQEASACDPDQYEIAYRWVQAVRHTSSDAATEQAVSQVLAQSQWTGHEEQMLRQLKRPLGS